MFFETKRLYTRELRIDDLEKFVEMQNNTNVMKYITGKKKSREESTKELENIIRSYKHDGQKLIMGVFEKENNNFVGTCAVIKNLDEEYEIGYRFDEKYWGFGYGTEIADCLVNYAFKNMGIGCLYAYVDKENYPSVKILEKLSFEKSDEYIDETDNLVLSYKKENNIDK